MTRRGLYVATVAQTGAWGDLWGQDEFEDKAHRIMHYTSNKRAGEMLNHVGDKLRKAEKSSPVWINRVVRNAGTLAYAGARAFHGRADEGLEAHRARLKARHEARTRQEYI